MPTDLLRREPVRLYLYGVLVAVLLLAAGYGLVADAELVLWLALGQAVLAVPAVEAARAAVTSPATLARRAGELREVASAATTAPAARPLLYAVADRVESGAR